MFKKISVVLLIVFILLLIISRYADKNNSFIKDQTGKNIFINENLDFKKEVLFTTTGMADYAVAAPKNSKELYETSKHVVTGKAIASELCIDKESGFTYTLVKFHRDELIKGSIERKEFSVAYIGGYMSGEKYMEVHPDYRMSIIKGADEKEVREGLGIK
jgi:hypothetical protein